ncbi:hypothetical protein G7Y89_g925 [Cudoniella acicularis]|uniref:malate dehydrogenase n=1 Tax=Cudoniella acicularis TaxID=354080 RepID=A0A8H4RY12_9HELO|nr:hypothetical protein G7Y89_g925 [Cudoniella acicularis]
MSHHSSQVSADLIWEISRSQNAFLVKRAQSGGVRFSRDPFNLVNIHSRKHAGFVNDKAVGVEENKDKSKGVTLITKKVKHPQRPASHVHKVTIGGNKSTRKTFKTIASNTAKSGYRPDIRAEAVARASAIRKSQQPKKDAPEAKLRGAKAKKAADAVVVIMAGKALALSDEYEAQTIRSPKSQTWDSKPPLSLLLKTSPLISELALYDVVNTPGVAADLSHISSPAKITGYLPKDDGAKLAFKDADIIVIPAGIPRKPGMTRDDLFNINAGIVKGLIEVIADVAPKAYILIISNPVNSTVPIAAEVLKAKGVFNPKRLFGVTTLDVVRAETFVAEIIGTKNPQDLNIPVIGGHSGETIVPLFSQAKPSVTIPADKLADLVKRVQFGGDEVVKAKDGAGSATLSMAFAEAVLKGLSGEKGIVTPTFVYLPGISGGEVIAKETGLDFFSVPVELGTTGAEKAQNPLTNLDDNEKTLLKAAVEGLKGNIAKGVSFAHNPPQK